MTPIAPGWLTTRASEGRSPYRPVKVLAIRRWTARDIRVLRLKLGVSQTTMAAMLGVNRVSLTKWENGSDLIERESIHRLLSLLETAPELFFREPR